MPEQTNFPVAGNPGITIDKSVSKYYHLVMMNT